MFAIVRRFQSATAVAPSSAAPPIRNAVDQRPLPAPIFMGRPAAISWSDIFESRFRKIFMFSFCFPHCVAITSMAYRLDLELSIFRINLRREPSAQNRASSAHRKSPASMEFGRRVEKNIWKIQIFRASLRILWHPISVEELKLRR